MMVKENKLVKSFRNLNLGVVLTPYSLRLNQLRVVSDFKSQIAQAQREADDFLRSIVLAEEGKLKGFAQGMDGLWRFEGRIYIPISGDLRRRILEEAHDSKCRSSLQIRILKLNYTTCRIVQPRSSHKDVDDYLISNMGSFVCMQEN